ncbi:CLUMA_CG016444, isoform A [Clunio marinus]|uniref:Autophagy-related protein 2 n=1 Tax=Clunio marinus TaxID=568069 RepID=A0A1J1IRZ7_9DIPT|nr:CLUMA_CG016444, isoform A [Clunio marinus]
MPWFNISDFSFSDFIKKRVCKFLINRYLGRFFEEKLTADQICLDLYNGKGSVYNVNLCCEAINSIFEAQGWDFEVTSGQIGSVTVNVPWNCLMSEDSFVEVSDLRLCLRPQARAKDDGTSMLESMWSSMSSSMQLAQECLEKNEDEETVTAQSSSNMEGLEKFALTIDNILNRIKAKFINTEVRLEYLPKDSDVGVTLIIKIKSFEYQNEASSEAQQKDESSEKNDQKTILLATHDTHHIALEDITFYTEEFRIGALTLFFTPRQMHMLLLLCDILLNGEATPSNVANDNNEMSFKADIDEKQRRYAGGLMTHQTWSGDDYGFHNQEFTSARDLHVIDKLRPVSSDSVFSSNSSSMTSSMISSAGSHNTARRRRAIERDQNADISHFSIRIAGIFLVILHDDILVTTTTVTSTPLNELSVDKLINKCEHFFNYVSDGIATCNTSDLMKIGSVLRSACCDNNHLRLMLAPVIVDGEERRTVKGNCTKLNISISRADVHEILGDLCLPIIEFYRKDSTTMIPEMPEVSVTMEKTLYVLKGSTGKQYFAPRLNLGITLATGKLDFDISVFDRLNALFSSPFSSFMSDGMSSDQDNVNELSPNSQKIVQSKSKIKIQSETFNLVLRFPIVDLRPIHDPEKRPWWQRNIRTDFIVFKFSDFQLNIISPSTYDVIANEILVQYLETEKATPINVAKASFFVNSSGKYYPSSTDYPRIVVQFPTDEQLQDMNEAFIREQSNRKSEDTDSDPASGDSIKINLSKDSTPFGTKKVCRESDTPHGKSDEDESETLLIPGDRDEINNFCDNAMKFSKIQIKVDLPVVSVQLKSKHLYEVIYNRIISDILMWESNVPKAKPPEVPITLKKPPDSLMNAGMMDSMYAPFAMCKSKINFESSSSATNSESESDNDQIFYSMNDKNRGGKKLLPIYQKDYSNSVSFQLHIGQGMMTMYAPVRDTQNHVVPGQLGEFVLRVNSTKIFTVSSYHGNSNIGYFCIQSANLEVFHCGLLPVPIQNPPLRDIYYSLPAWLKSTLYATPKNLTLNENRGSLKRDMISLAVQIKANPDQGLKRTKISVGVQMATLRHNSTLSEHLWLTQLMDMFDIKEDIVPGYTPYTNLTEFHLHLWDCAIDYRPLHYPFRAIATIGNFMISSNIATGSVGCTLRFVAEDATLSLAPQILNTTNENQKRDDENKITSLPSTELICVTEMGLFEISLRLNDKVTPLSPKYDLRAAIKDVHIRTCSDSGKALLEFISYLASEGDLVDEQENDEVRSEASSMPQSNEPEDDPLLQMKTSDRIAPEVTQTQQNHVKSLMADAMEESIYIPSSHNHHANINNTSNDDSDELVDLGTDVFFFPDEQEKREIRFGAVRKADSYKRRCASEDSISIDSSSYRDDEEIFVRRFEQKEEEDSGSVNTEMRELLDFESSVMVGLKEPIEDFDPLPQVEMDLGDISKYETPPKRPQPARGRISSDSDDDFCIVADEERPSYGDVQVAQTDDPIRIIDNHFSAPHGKPDLLKAPADFPMAVQRYTLCEMTLVWHMFGGHDFPNDDDKKKEKEERDEINRRAFTNYPMSEVYKMGVSYTKGSPSLTLGGGGGNQTKLTWKTRGGYGRKHDILMEIHLNKVRFSHETYPTTTEQASRQVLLVTELEIRDRLAISNINKFLYHPTVGFRTRQGNHHMVVIKALHLRPEPALKTQECCLRISLLPIRLNIDQDSLLFLINFFNELSGGKDFNESKTNNAQNALKLHQPPVMMVELPEAAQELQARKMVSENLTLLLNEDESGVGEDDDEDRHRQGSANAGTTEAPNETSTDTSSPIFFRHVIFSPDVPIRLDYQGKRVELSHGPLAGLLMGLGQLQCSEIRLKRISYRHGILGVDRLLNYLIQEWLHDIKKRQLPKILGGVGPMYSLVQLFQGIFDLFWLPIEQYQKDGRIVRGIQRGAQSFTARTALAALEITSRIIYLLQITAETAFDMVSPVGPSVRRRVNRKGKRKRIHPPQDIREGMSNAYHIVKDGIGDTAQTIIQMAALEHDQKGYTGAVGAVMRQIPPTMVRPIVLATQATTNVLGGLKNELIPNARIEAKEKWKDDEEN